VQPAALTRYPALARKRVVGIRPGEKLHEEMISEESARNTLDAGDHYVVQPDVDWWIRGRLEGTPVPDGFSYTSDTNTEWLSIDALRAIVAGL
jgi:UDP-N-acetylglucosamine 4,6-dehydratase